MKIAFFSTKSYDRDFFNLLNKHNEIEYFETNLTVATANLLNGHKAVCVFVNDSLSREVIHTLKNKGVELISLRCAGFNNVDMAAAHEIGIKVVRVPAYSPQAVAEHALALIMTLCRKTHKAYNRVRENNFSLEKLNGFNLFGKTVGVVGTGEIGSAFCKIMLGIGCKVIAYDIMANDELEQRGVKYLPLKEVFQQSDIISLHCPLNEYTKYVIDKNTLAQMKKGVMIINTSRGGLINSRHAIKALKTGHLGYLGLDVYEQEAGLFFQDLSNELIQDDVISRLMTFPNVLITAHQGFFTNEALEEIANITLSNINQFENGIELTNEVKV
ncbi:D-lactate dehydrogenase [Spirosomataceae bacterium TFI 002]|nr:D-lactate dehydrogenase [Spirosomataceae bacterium TFI 002]